MNTNTTTSSSQNSEQNSGKVPCKKLASFPAVVGVMQQPTTEASQGHQPTALSFLPEQPGLGFKLSPGTLADTQSQGAVQQRAGVGDSGLVPGVKCDGASTTESKSMKIQPTTKQTNSEPTTPEGEYQATVKSVAEKVSDGQSEVVVEYVLVGVPESIQRTYPAKIGGRSPLWRDSKAILRRTLLTSEEAETGFDPAVLTGHQCRVVVAHRADGSGKLTAQAKLVLARKDTPVVEVATGV